MKSVTKHRCRRALYDGAGSKSGCEAHLVVVGLRYRRRRIITGARSRKKSTQSI